MEFDASDSQHGPKSTLARFRRAPIAQKRGLFNGASRLLTGTSFPCHHEPAKTSSRKGTRGASITL